MALTNENNITTYATRQFSTYSKNLFHLKKWLSEHNCKEVCMESTSKYWIPIYNILKASCNITLANPKYIINSFKYHDFKRSIDTFGKSSSAIIKYAIEHPDKLDIDYTQFLHKSMLSKADEIKIAIQGNISKDQTAKMSVCLNHYDYDYINNCISQLDTAISLISSEFKSQIELVASAPGITTHSATVIISEIGVDMSVFPDATHLCSWAGLTPKNKKVRVKRKVFA
ncbi:transposase [Clostridium kluyveri]|uniref:transposase n=1 Tax=Clostridium kluyveri TaxID=1534 RepID=UPI00224646B0|nr:transposase [Clostridium kluyveri]UZQ50533.1 IS110 family transposase [Clostridium kluyveri]